MSVAPPGGRSVREFADELVSQAEGLLSFFATAPEPGFSAADLVLARRGLSAGPAEADQAAGQDVEPAPAARPDEAERKGLPAAGTALEALPPDEPGPAPAQAGPGPAADRPGPAAPAPAAPAPTAVPGRSPSRLPGIAVPWPAGSLRKVARWAGARRPGGKPGRGTPAGAAARGPAVSAAPVTALAYVVLTCLDSSEARSRLRRGRALVLEIDQQLAALPTVSYWVRALQGAADAGTSTCQPAGQLGRGQLRAQASQDDFGPALARIRTFLDRDGQALARSSGAVPRAAAVIVALDAPVADAQSVRLYEELCQDCPVIWITLGQAEALLSPAFTDGAAARLDDAPDLASEVAARLTGLVTAPDRAAGAPAAAREH